MRYYLAIDIGASSGRHIVGWQEDGALQTKEVYRFPNGVHDQDGHLVWDIHSLYESIVNGIREAFKQYPAIESLSIDTWGVDYVLLRGDQEILPVYAYRDGRTEAVIPPLDLVKIGKLTFAEPDGETFPLLPLAKKMLAVGGAAPAVLNAANEIAVDAFLKQRIPLLSLFDIVLRVTADMPHAAQARTLTEIIDMDREARERALAMI